MFKKTVIIIASILLLFSLLLIGGVYLVKSLLGNDQENSYSGKNGVGLVEVKGMIIDSRETVRQLRYFLKKDDIKSVVLRVDSPGGVVAPSQEIYEEVKKFASKKKIIVSMGSLAASGGYYISAPATLIYANPGTITASIGVIIKLSNVEALMDKIGIKATVIKTGKFKDSGSPARKMTEEDRAMFQSVIDSTHNQFVRAVAAGRKLPEDQVRKIADGRVLSGEQALGLKLVDRLGTMQDAIEEAGRQAGISGEPQLVLPPKKKVHYLDLLTEGVEEKFDGALNKAVGHSLQMVYE